MLKRVMFLVVMIVATATAALAQDADLINPDRPGIADGSTTLGRHRFQVEASLERDDTSTTGALQRSLTTPLLLRYGLTNAFELRVETNGYHRDASPGGRSSGCNPTSLGFKAHLLEEDDKAHVPSVGVIGRLFVPSGSGEFRSSHATGDLRRAADMNLNKHWAINTNVGVDFDDSGDGRFTAALAALTAHSLISGSEQQSPKNSCSPTAKMGRNRGQLNKKSLRASPFYRSNSSRKARATTGSA